MTQEALNERNMSESEFLKSYDASRYERPSVTVDMLIFTVSDEEADNYRKLPEKALKLLLIKRGNHPYKGHWALPGGFVELTESLDEAAFRELKEETGLEKVYLEQLYTWGDVGRDPRTRVISTSYMALADASELIPEAGDDADEAKWFTVSFKACQDQKTITSTGSVREVTCQLVLESGSDRLHATVKHARTTEGNHIGIRWEILDSEGLAFDHAKIIAYGVDRLRNKIAYTDIAFHLMPDRFTLTQLQQVYEVILEKELLKANFRRKVALMVHETNDYLRDAGHRPSKLYRFNPEWTRNDD